MHPMMARARKISIPMSTKKVSLGHLLGITQDRREVSKMPITKHNKMKLMNMQNAIQKSRLSEFE